MNIKRLIQVIIIFLIVIFIIVGLDDSIEINYYSYDIGEVDENIRLAFISDYHSNSSEAEVLELLEEIKPDAILLGGDIVDDEMPYEAGYSFIESVADDYPVYYVSGNHEYWSNEYELIRENILLMDVSILEGGCQIFEKGNDSVNICGIDDFENKLIYKQLDMIEHEESSGFKILLAHRPEKINLYKNVDLVLSGHAHGGQWRIPFILDGLFSPNQGLLPEYTSGVYKFDDKDMIVNRGLAKESTVVPRFYNKREIIVIDLK